MRSVTIYINDPDHSIPAEEMCEDALRAKGIEVIDEEVYLEAIDEE